MCAEDLPVLCRRDGDILDKHGSRDIAEDEMAVAVGPVEVAGRDLRIDHEHRFRMPGANKVCRRLDAERGRGAGDVHVEGKAFDAERFLHLSLIHI